MNILNLGENFINKESLLYFMKSKSSYYKKMQTPSKFANDVMVLYNEYNDMAKIYANGDVIMNKRKLTGKWKNKQDAALYFMKLGYYYG